MNLLPRAVRNIIYAVAIVWAFVFWMLSLIIIITAIILFLGFYNPAHGRDADGRYAQSPLKQWFNSLKNKNGVGCCDTSDGKRVEDADWGIENDSYWVMVDGQKLVVPPEALLTQKNRAGVAIVWPMSDQDGKTIVRCFIPGTLT